MSLGQRWMSESQTVNRFMKITKSVQGWIVPPHCLATAAGEPPVLQFRMLIKQFSIQRRDLQIIFPIIIFATACYLWLQHCRPSTSLAWHSGLNLKVGLWTKTPKRTNLFCGTFPGAKIQQTESNAWTRAFIELRYLLHPGVQSSCFHGVLFSPEGPQDGWKNWQERNLALKSFESSKCYNSKSLRDRTKVQRQIYALWPEEHYQTMICIKNENRFHTGFF